MPLKRAIDIAGSGLALLVSVPLLAVISAAVALDSGFPVLYRQWRVGLGFRPFQLLKFRSMVTSDGGPRITAAGDSRVTRIGKILRATKLDELPQFWNVLRGDMSLVGPRPELPEYVELLRERYEGVLVVRPGITDLASVRFRNEEELLSRSPEPLRNYTETVLPVKLDLADEYVRKRSFWVDLLILGKTLAVVLRIR